MNWCTCIEVKSAFERVAWASVFLSVLTAISTLTVTNCEKKHNDCDSQISALVFCFLYSTSIIASTTTIRKKVRKCCTCMFRSARVSSSLRLTIIGNSTDGLRLKYECVMFFKVWMTRFALTLHSICWVSVKKWTQQKQCNSRLSHIPMLVPWDHQEWTLHIKFTLDPDRSLCQDKIDVTTALDLKVFFKSSQ